VTAAHLLLAAFLFRSCLWAAEERVPPSFTTDSIVSSANGSPSSLTPNGLATITGSRLAEVTQSIPEVLPYILPTTLGGVRIRIGGIFAYLLYVSPGRINFLIPNDLVPGNFVLTLMNQSLFSQARIKLLDVAPALFCTEGWVAATHADGSLISASAPARSGEIVVIYGAGLGRVEPSQPTQFEGGIQRFAAQILLLSRLQVFIDGQSIPLENILYAGVSPGSVGLYQINLRLPDKMTKEDPELRIALDDQFSQSALTLHLAADTP
jgi:uncharacterized protein (TIGR03437 family)